MSIPLPKENYKQFYGTSGLATSEWGPHAWIFLFASIHGGYPVKIDPNNKDHINIRKHYKHMLLSLQFTMPCIFCRNSYKNFIKETPIDNFLSGRIQLMYWLYIIKDKVNKKLISQQIDAYNKSKLQLKSDYHTGLISKEKYYSEVQKCRNNTLKTKSSPPFIDVLERYEKMRASCSTIYKSCVLPKKK
uniref:thiol oxidase n=1 Tax=viral metagenome TaxID=1070528 RepID=A0A6C0E156_9ZZZZ